VHVALNLGGSHGGVGQGDVEVGLGGVLLVGPGVSMLAKVVARMNGGVSSRMGRTSDGMVTILCSLMKLIRLSKVARKLASS